MTLYGSLIAYSTDKFSEHRCQTRLISFVFSVLLCPPLSFCPFSFDHCIEFVLHCIHGQ